MSFQFSTDGYINWSISVVLNPNDPYASFKQGTFRYDFPVDGFSISGVSGTYSTAGLTYSAGAPVTVAFSDPIVGAALTFSGAEQQIQNGKLVVQPSNWVNLSVTYADGSTTSGLVQSTGIGVGFRGKEVRSFTLSQVVDQGWTSTGTVTVANSIGLAVDSFNFFSRTSSTVDLNNLTADQRFLLHAGGRLEQIADGDRTVTMPDQHIVLDWVTSNFYQPGWADTIQAGAGNQVIQAGLTTQTVYFGPDKNTVYAAPNVYSYLASSDSSGNRKPTGPDILDYQHGKFANFSQFAANSLAYALSNHPAFQTDINKQSIILLPGAPNDYQITQSFAGDRFGFSYTRGEIKTLAGNLDNFPAGITIAENFERVTFAKALSSPNVTLTGNSVASEMLQLAAESYGPAFPNPAYTKPGLHSAEALAYDANNWGRVAGAAAARNWHVLNAVELGMAPADFGQLGNLKYSFVGGVYQAVNLTDFAPAAITGTNMTVDGHAVGGDPSEADALVLTGMVNGKRTLAIAFRGTDQGADWLDYANFQSYFAKFAPLVAAIKSFAADTANGIQQVLISGHSLGAAAAQYFLHQMPDTAAYHVQAYTEGSPGAEVVSGDHRIENFYNSDDPIPLFGTEAFNFVKHIASYLLDREGGVAGEIISTLVDQVEDKHHEGSSITFHNDVGGYLSAFSLNIGHNYSIYQQEVAALRQFASDPLSPFSQSALGKSLIDGTIYQGSTSIALAGVGFTQSIMAPYTNEVHVRRQDDYVLGVGGGRIDWDQPIPLVDVLHVVDGGAGGSDVVLLGPREWWSWQTTSTGIGPETDLRYFGGLVGQLYRVNNLVFPFGAGSSVPVVPLDGHIPTVQRPTAASSLTISSAYDYADLGNSNVNVTGSGQGDIIAIGSGNDTINEFTGDSIIFVKDPATAGNLLVAVNGGNNLVVTGRGNDTLYGGYGGVNTFAPGGGQNRVDGRGGQTVLSLEGPQNEFQFSSQLQSDGNVAVILAHSGSTGRDGIDTLIRVQTVQFTDATVHLVTGTVANDTLSGSLGSDFFTGSAGDDRFVFARGDGADTVTDFAAGIHTDDRIDLTAFHATFANVLAHASQSGANTVFNFGGGDTLTLQNVAKAGLSAEDFAGLKVTRSDFGANGDSDILWARDNGAVSIWDDGQIGGAHIIANAGAVPNSWHIAGRGDFDGNGHNDVLWRNDNSAVSIWDDGQIGGAHIIANAGVVPNSWHISGTGDFDGNGQSDILWRNDNGAASIWDNGAIGNAHIIANAGAVSNSWHIAGTGDFDGNGRDDILWRNDNGAASIWDNGAIGGAHIIANAGVVPNSWHIAGTGDFDRDGLSDILWRNDNGAASIWDTGAIGNAHIIANAGVVPNSWHISGTGDFDGDGHDDILWRNDNGAASIWDHGLIERAHIIANAGVVPNDWHIV